MYICWSVCLVLSHVKDLAQDWACKGVRLIQQCANNDVIADLWEFSRPSFDLVGGDASHPSRGCPGTGVELVNEEAGELVLTDEGERLEKILSYD